MPKKRGMSSRFESQRRTELHLNRLEDDSFKNDNIAIFTSPLLSLLGGPLFHHISPLSPVSLREKQRHSVDRAAIRNQGTLEVNLGRFTSSSSGVSQSALKDHPTKIG